MSKVILTVESEEFGAEYLESCLEALRPVLTILTGGTIHVIVQQED